MWESKTSNFTCRLTLWLVLILAMSGLSGFSNYSSYTKSNTSKLQSPIPYIRFACRESLFTVIIIVVYFYSGLYVKSQTCHVGDEYNCHDSLSASLILGNWAFIQESKAHRVFFFKSQECHGYYNLSRILAANWEHDQGRGGYSIYP